MKTNKISGIARTLIQGLMCLPLLALPSAAQNVSRLLLEESSNLQSWQAVPVTPAMLDANGEILVPTDTPEKFYRMKLELLMPPSFRAQPASVSITSGQTTTLNVAASGTGPFTYQWYEGSVGTTTTPVGTNSASFTTPALTATTDYWVKVTNALGAVNSSAATVTVTSGLAPLRAVESSAATETETATSRLAAPGWVKPSDATEALNSGAVVPTDMALIPAGAFTMGDAPPVTVTVSEFYMGKYEVTKALWDEVRTYGAANGYTDLSVGGGKEGYSNHPVHSISWSDMVKWCNAHSQKDGLTPVYTVNGATMKTGTSEPTADWSANGYRLPTEAEWEKAARGGVDGKRFPWGTDTISHSDANYLATTWYSYDLSGYNRTGKAHPTYREGSPVGSFAANGYGLYDMAGNVSEWCWNWYEGASYVSGATDPRGATSGTHRAFRGGSSFSFAGSCNVAARSPLDPRSPVGIPGIGFRVARSSTGPEQANTAPTISDIAAQSITAGSNTGALAFTVGDSQTAASSLTLSGSSSNATLVPNASIVFGGSGASRTVTVTPAMGQSGTATITVTVSDGSLSTSGTFVLEVISDPAAPTGFSLIPSGSFIMGDAVDGDSANPTRTVDVSAFYMAKNLTTKAEWDIVRAWANSNGYTDLVAGSGNASDHPVLMPSWYQAVKFCNARSQQEGLTPVYYTDEAQTTVYKTGNPFMTDGMVKWTANGYRLPTEAEWEKAARGGLSGKRYPWGDTISQTQASYDPLAVDVLFPSYATDWMPNTSPVGSFAANGYSLNDMAGNVMQWCWDQPRYDRSVRHARGGSWVRNESYCRVAKRFFGYSNGAISTSFGEAQVNQDFGFRVARGSTGPEQANTEPTISDIAAQSITAGSNTGALAFTVGDAQTAASSLTLSASSSNASLVPNASIVFEGSGASRMVTVTPAMGQSGTATITVTVSDGSLSTSGTFVLTVANTPTAPTGFSLIPSGSFIMGDAVDGDSANPTRTVDVSAFYMAKNLTTKAEWDTVRAWANSNGYTDLVAGSGNASDHPVLMPSWYQAVKFCNARSQQEGLTPVYYTDEAQTTVYKTGNAVLTDGMVKWTANGYRLPTEAEWEKAARGGLSGKRYPWGDTISQTQASYDPFASDNFVAFASSAWWTAPLPNTSPVGSFAANGYGLNDMAGNVMQWCWDEVKVTEYFVLNGNYQRMARGGSGVRNESFCRVAKQYPGLSDGVYHGWPTIPVNADFGFRVARSSVPY